MANKAFLHPSGRLATICGRDNRAERHRLWGFYRRLAEGRIAVPELCRKHGEQYQFLQVAGQI